MGRKVLGQTGWHCDVQTLGQTLSVCHQSPFFPIHDTFKPKPDLSHISQSPTQLTDNMATHRDPDLELLESKIDALIAVMESRQGFAVRIPFSNFAAQCDLLVREQGRSAAELDLASVQDMLKIIDVVQADLMRYKADMKRYAKSIHHSCEILRAREHAIKARIPGYRKRQDPINKKRVAAGLEPIGAGINWSHSSCPTGSRGASSDVPARKRRHGEEEEA